MNLSRNPIRGHGSAEHDGNLLIFTVSKFCPIMQTQLRPDFEGGLYRKLPCKAEPSIPSALNSRSANLEVTSCPDPAEISPLFPFGRGIEKIFILVRRSSVNNPVRTTIVTDSLVNPQDCRVWWYNRTRLYSSLLYCFREKDRRINNLVTCFDIKSLSEFTKFTCNSRKRIVLSNFKFFGLLTNLLAASSGQHRDACKAHPFPSSCFIRRITFAPQDFMLLLHYTGWGNGARRRAW